MSQKTNIPGKKRLLTAIFVIVYTFCDSENPFFFGNVQLRLNFFQVYNISQNVQEDDLQHLQVLPSTEM